MTDEQISETRRVRRNVWEVCKCGHDRKEHKKKLCIYRDREDRTCTGWEIDEKATQEIEAMVADFQSAFQVRKVSGTKWEIKQTSNDKVAQEIAKRFNAV